MELAIQDRVAFVGGSSAGLGRAIAEELAAEGAFVVICSRSLSKLQPVAEKIEKSGGTVLAVEADLATEEGSEQAVSRTLSERGRVDILVTNVGGPPSGYFDDLTPQMWKDAFSLTLESVLNLTRGFLPGMKERKWGRIVNVTSVAVKQPVDGLMLSNSIRAAVTGFASSLANEVASLGITVNNVLPGYTRTERLEELAAASAERIGGEPARMYEQWSSETPMGRLGEPRELAALVAFLVSERASYITGTSITVDGGWVRGLL